MTDTPCIMLIRHAEKPAEGEQAVDLRGAPDAGSLSVRGWERAGALVPLFAPLDGRGTASRLQRPLHLVAARATLANPSTRPRDTLQPLAAALELAVDERWSAEDPLAAVAGYLRNLQGPALVCWRHDSLPALADELLQRSEAPSRWPDERFDLIWVIERAGLSWTFTQLPQQLLAQDRAQAIPRRVVTRARPAARAAG